MRHFRQSCSQPVLREIIYDKAGKPTWASPLTHEGLARFGAAAMPPCGYIPYRSVHIPPGGPLYLIGFPIRYKKQSLFAVNSLSGLLFHIMLHFSDSSGRPELLHNFFTIQLPESTPPAPQSVPSGYRSVCRTVSGLSAPSSPFRSGSRFHSHGQQSFQPER